MHEVQQVWKVNEQQIIDAVRERYQIPAEAVWAGTMPRPGSATGIRFIFTLVEDSHELT